MPTHINIQVSTEQLLELLGDDPEVRLSIQSSIVQQFATKHLKAVINHDMMKEIEKDLQTAVAQEIADQVGTWAKNTGPWERDRRFEPSQAISDTIKQLAGSAVIKTYETLIKEAVDKRQEWIESAVSQRLGQNITKMVDDEVKRRLTAAAES